MIDTLTQSLFQNLCQLLLSNFMQSFLWCHFFIKKSIYDEYSNKSNLEKFRIFITPMDENWTFIFVHFGNVIDSFFKDIERFLFYKNIQKTCVFKHFLTQRHKL